MDITLVVILITGVLIYLLLWAKEHIKHKWLIWRAKESHPHWIRDGRKFYYIENGKKYSIVKMSYIFPNIVIELDQSMPGSDRSITVLAIGEYMDLGNEFFSRGRKQTILLSGAIFEKEGKEYHTLGLGFKDGKRGLWLALKDDENVGSKELGEYLVAIKTGNTEGISGLSFHEMTAEQLMKLSKGEVI